MAGRKGIPSQVLAAELGLNWRQMQYLERGGWFVPDIAPPTAKGFGARYSLQRIQEIAGQVLPDLLRRGIVPPGNVNPVSAPDPSTREVAPTFVTEAAVPVTPMPVSVPAPVLPIAARPSAVPASAPALTWVPVPAPMSAPQMQYAQSMPPPMPPLGLWQWIGQMRPTGGGFNPRRILGPCVGCRGARMLPDGQRCPACMGLGVVSGIRQLCPQCRGRGFEIIGASIQSCRVCRGMRWVIL